MREIGQKAGGKPQLSRHLSQALKNEEEGGTSFQAKETAQGHLEMESRCAGGGSGESGRGLASSSVLCRAHLFKQVNGQAHW